MKDSKPLPTVPGYRLLRPIGAGGMGSVYEGEKLSTHETFAVKLIREHLTADASYLARFEREITVLRAIRHPNVVDVFEWSFGDAEHDVRPYVVMELLEGESVDQLVRREKILPPARAVGILLQVLEGLAAAHAQGVLHRDLGPSNMFIALTARGKLSVKLLDFGLARAMLGGDAGRSVTQEGTLMGKPAYVSPEHFLGRPLDPRSDLFACGVVLFRMLTGRLPYKSSDAQMLWVERWSERESAAELPSVRDIIPDLPEPLAHVVARALRKNPDQRYRSALEMQADLLAAERALAGVPAPSATESYPPPAEPLPTVAATMPAASQQTPRPPVTPEGHSSTVVGRSTVSHVTSGSSRRSVAFAAAVVVFAAVAVVLAIRIAIGSGGSSNAPPAAAAAASPSAPPLSPSPDASSAPAPDAGTAPPVEPVKVVVPEPDAGLPESATVAQQVPPPVPGRDAATRADARVSAPPDAVTVAARPDDAGTSMPPRPDAGTTTAVRADAGTSTPPAADAVATRPPRRDVGGPAVVDGRMGTSFVVEWGDGR
jgi:serine/threonine protein kinase